MLDTGLSQRAVIIPTRSKSRAFKNVPAIRTSVSCAIELSHVLLSHQEHGE